MLDKDISVKILVAGLGNPILSDDGVGWVVAQKVASCLGSSRQDVCVENFALAGLSLMEQMIGFDEVILVDSLNTGIYSQGDVMHFTMDSLSDLTYGHSPSAHDLSLKKALALGRTMGVDLPEDENVHIIAIEARHVFEFGEDLTPSIEAAVPVATQQVLDVLHALNR